MDSLFCFLFFSNKYYYIKATECGLNFHIIAKHQIAKDFTFTFPWKGETKILVKIDLNVVLLSKISLFSLSMSLISQFNTYSNVEVHSPNRGDWSGATVNF